jgi:hypothetical protein
MSKQEYLLGCKTIQLKVDVALIFFLGGGGGGCCNQTYENTEITLFWDVIVSNMYESIFLHYTQSDSKGIVNHLGGCWGLYVEQEM